MRHKPGTIMSYLLIASFIFLINVTYTVSAAWKSLCPDNVMCFSLVQSTQLVTGPTAISAGVSLSFIGDISSEKNHHIRLLIYPTSPLTSIPFNVHLESLLQLPSGNWIAAHAGEIKTLDQQGNVLNVHSTPVPALSHFAGLLGPVFYKNGIIYSGRRIGSGITLNVSNDDGFTWKFASLDKHRFNEEKRLQLEPILTDQFINNPFGPGFFIISEDSPLTSAQNEKGLYLITNQATDFALINDLKFFTDSDNQLNYIMPDPAPDNPDEQVLYGATNRGLYISRDGGRNWSVLNASLGAFHRIAVVHDHTPKLLLASTTQGLEVSRDGGLHWSLFEQGMYKDIQQIFYINGVLLARNSAGWYQCADFACEGEATPIPDTTKRGEVKVVEFHHSELDHYFITSDPQEIAGIDNGSAGAGWTRTGYEFNAWTAFGHPDRIGKPVCRFYGSQSPGPNSHFFSSSASECELLHNLQKTTADDKPRWNFESLAFNVEIVDAETGACRSGRIPVYRAYNNGFARGKDSNHRFVPNQKEINKLVARGWADEGIAFCATP